MRPYDPKARAEAIAKHANELATMRSYEQRTTTTGRVARVTQPDNAQSPIHKDWSWNPVSAARPTKLFQRQSIGSALATAAFRKQLDAIRPSVVAAQKARRAQVRAANKKAKANMKTTTNKKAASKAAKKSTKGGSIAKLRRDALKHFGVDPYDRDALLAAIGGKSPKPSRANIVKLAKNGQVKVDAKADLAKAA